MLPYGTPKRHFWVHFAFRIPTKSTLGALLVPLFGQFRDGVLRSSGAGSCIGPVHELWAYGRQERLVSYRVTCRPS
jgi:hypothetical protein